eukprot:CAMPEP_0117056738 /NCGR_PEP_ID=MMETSP0472-20121206/39374_1 /TAXON_ID=693140 ORGANISM="Tiarina fusus, Strain LIS" /NCGR_SAMPLE_ID=MMETSP0472 /ASSEMBLY_ACC=CAM_ASM_000603 /LENGTH=837 /DNA_ID=CAMNT_0004773319 /DNA_START=135 /DNA_END=2649 /DNA_ORIENTATION=+
MSKSVFLLVLQLVFASVLGGADVDYLYGDNHYPVKEYTGGNSIFETSDSPRVVEFYSPHCPACIAFRPEYLKLARDTRFKYKEAAFFAVSCDHHEDVCSKMGIDDYPTLFVYPAGEEGKRVPHGSYTPEVLAKKLKLTAAARTTATKLRRRMEENAGGGDDDAPNKDDDAAGTNSNGDDDAVNNGGAGDDDDAASNSGNGDDDAANNSGAGDDDTANNSGAGDDDATQNSGNGDDDTANNSGNGDDDATQNSGGNGDDDATQNSGGNGDDDATTNNGGNGDDDTAQNSGGSGDDDAVQNSGGSGDDDTVQNSAGSGDDDATNGNGDDDKTGGEASSRYTPSLPMAPQVEPVADRRPGAGAIRASKSFNDMDRFQDEIKKHKKEYDKKRKGVGKLLRRDGRKDKKGKPVERTNPEAKTKAMMVHTPGTAEYNERKEKVMKRIKKVKKEVPAVLTKETLPFKKDVRKETFVRRQAERLPIVKRFVKMTPEEQLILDVSVSLVAALETGSFVGVEDKELSREKKNALKDFLDLLSVSLPPEWGIHKLIDDLRRRIAYVAQNSKNLRFVIGQHPLPRRGWSDSCTKRARSSGYSCGLWKLFHVATVGVAEHRGGLNLVKSGMVSDTAKTFSPIEAAEAIKGFIEHFFSCKSCREHFVERYEDCDNNRRCDRLSEELEEAGTADWKELPLWMWEVHNEVSIHVLRQRIERDSKVALMGNAKAGRRATPQEEVSVIWPNVETCVMCFEDDGTWDEAEVFKFLERNYWPDSELDPKTDKLMQFDGESGFFSALMMWAMVFMIVYAIYNVVKKNSAAISQSVVMARHVVKTTGVKVAPRRKERTN